MYLCTKSDAANVSTSKGVALAELHVHTTQLSEAAALNLFTTSGLRSILTMQLNNLTLYILERPSFTFPLLSLTPSSPINPVCNPYTTPSLSEFQLLWKAWDLVTLGMIPPSMLHQKPIDLRHKPLFYIGHLPTFNALLLTKLLRVPMVEPRSYATIFERGIDPHVDDPNHCHNHSVVPECDEDWPVLGEVLGFRDRVRRLVETTLGELARGERTLTRRMARTLMMLHEHEAWHIETILYMLIQRAGTGALPPPGFTRPPWALLAAQWDAVPPPTTPAAVLGPCDVVLGHDDAETDDLARECEHDVAAHALGWDNESPQRAVAVGRFTAEWRPVSNGEFLRFWRAQAGAVAMPASWVEEDGEVKVRTLYGPVAMDHARHWPCLTAYDDLAAYARSKGGRLPTEPELRLFLDTYQVGHEQGANVAFRNWHPLPATAGIGSNGRGSNGGVWEWTSTLLDAHAGFDGTTIFPGYSSDFFDSKHQVVLGASYATIPRLAERRTVRNFYQHNYPYPWVGARVVYDA